MVARLDRGEKVDVDEAAPPLDYGHDELGQVAQAFNTAQRTAVHTAVELADTRRGFQKVILGIARQSQNLVNLQLSKLDALEREHEDPKVLAGLYALDSNASQLRRYEENLVIISGEQPRRSWTEPVALIDILRSAVGEVAQYQRVEVLADEEVWLAPPAVADVIHLLAELIDNATAYSPAPSPVGVRAATVAKGLAIEIEDRGLGMSEEEYEAFNAQLAEAPQFDVVALADDLRLGMFVVARLAVRHGVGVTLRSSPYGGTTAIVLVPEEIVVRDRGGPPKEASAADADTAAPGGADTAAGETEDGGFATALTGQEGRSAQTPPDKGRPAPLPRRVPQTSLAAELLADPPEGTGLPPTTSSAPRRRRPPSPASSAAPARPSPRDHRPASRSTRRTVTGPTVTGRWTTAPSRSASPTPGSRTTGRTVRGRPRPENRRSIAPRRRGTTAPRHPTVRPHPALYPSPAQPCSSRRNRS